MKVSLLFFTFLIHTLVFAQDDTSAKIIEALQQKIEQSQQGEKLRWLDSLSNYIAYETNFESDSIVKKTVDYALRLDSLNIATWQTANRIYFFNNIKGNPQEGNRIFLEMLDRAKTLDNPNTLAKFYLEGADSFYFWKIILLRWPTTIWPKPMP